LAPFDHLTRDGEPGSATAANAATSVTKGGLHLPSLNGIRTVAFALVFLGHAGLNKIVPAAFGVTLFFFLSGYLITALLRLELEKTGTVSLKNFYLRRMLRILPPFYLVFACALGAYGVGLLPRKHPAWAARLVILAGANG
jgi:peptidoglycan/LPS O-acetylase OafA/YrhL